uniref:Si:dkeyp-74a11.1 n=1 Tax=Neogobius melanostomus TaxID=47308 RepID=A0A8C6U4Z1_9GOBI
MEKTLVEDDCVDSGAETGGSDYSPLSSTSINGADVSMGYSQDPYQVSVHLIADPGHGGFLQHATDAALSWIHPDLQLFRVSERAHRSKKRHPNGASQPALAVILFLQEALGGEEHILALHRALQRPPWRYHHTEKVSNGKRMLPLTPCSQDFFTLTSGTPLWAVRQVHYGKEIVRLTIYCRHENYADMVRLYKLLLQRKVAQKKDDFCFFVVYSNPELEIQLSFKRLRRGRLRWFWTRPCWRSGCGTWERSCRSCPTPAAPSVSCAGKRKTTTATRYCYRSKLPSSSRTSTLLSCTNPLLLRPRSPATAPPSGTTITTNGATPSAPHPSTPGVYYYRPRRCPSLWLTNTGVTSTSGPIRDIPINAVTSGRATTPGHCFPSQI